MKSNAIPFQWLDSLRPNPKRLFEGGRRLHGKHPVSDNNAPLVSVITVVFNNVGTLQRCVDAVLRQTFPNIEYIVIDGASSDGTLDVIKQYIDRIDYAVSEPDGGIYHAMNKGITLCRGDYICLINSDDWLEDDGVEVAVRALEKSRAEIGLAQANVWDKHGEFSHVWTVGNFDYRILLSGMSFCHQGVIASRKAYEVAGLYDDSIRISSDYKWVKQLFLSGLPHTLIEQPIVNFSFDGVSANNRPIWKEECKQMVCEQFPFMPYADVSAFLEYVYRDGPLDPNAVSNLINLSRDTPDALQSLALVLADRLSQAENTELAKLDDRVPLKEKGTKPFAAAGTPPQTTRIVRDPQISCIIPVYNVQDYIEECARSVLEQSFQDIEVIFVVDGSPDRSLDLILDMAASDSRVRIIHQRNGGLSAARNAGLFAAKGKYIHFLDSDDFIKPRMYERLHDYAEDNELDLVKSNLGFIDNVYPPKRPPLPSKEFFQLVDNHAYLQFISPCAALYRRELLLKHGIFEEGMTYEDRPFNWSTALHAGKIGHIDEVFYMYRLARPGSIMSSKKGNMRHFDALKSIDLIRELLVDSENFNSFILEFTKEQLRLYSMLIDIDAIPRRCIGKWYREIKSRISGLGHLADGINQQHMPPRLKNLFCFLTEQDHSPSSVSAGERYFFHGLDWDKSADDFPASACDLFMVGSHQLKGLIDHGRPYATIRESIARATVFEDIHFTKTIPNTDKLVQHLDALAVFANGSSLLAFLTLLEEQTTRLSNVSEDHLLYVASPAPNYKRCADAIERFFANKVLSSRTINVEDCWFVEDSTPLSIKYRQIVDDLRNRGFRTQPFSIQAGLLKFIGKRGFGPAAPESLTVLHPQSPGDRLLLDLWGDRSRTVFMPHGLPQVSMHGEPFDVVLPITLTEGWKEAFPQSELVHIGWPEASKTEGAPSTTRTDSRVSVTFLSQLTGISVHKLNDFKRVAEFFLSEAVSWTPDLFKVDFRLRSMSELELLDPTLVHRAEEAQHIRFTQMHDCPMHALETDVLISATSTGLLYAQELAVASIQLTTARLNQHWPFDLATQDRRYFIGHDNRAFKDVVLAASNTGPNARLYRPPSEADVDALLALAYGL